MWTQRPRSSGLWLGLVLAAGCGSSAVDVGEGGWVDLHRTDSAAMAEELAAMDVVARLRVVSDLVDEDPQGAAPYCSLLPHSTGRERCESASESAHLWEPPEDLEPATRAGRGLSRSMLTARDVPTSDWTQVKMAPPTDVADPQAQAWSRAREMAEDGSLHQIAQACAQLRGGERWRHDCFMTAALSRLQRLGRAGASEVFALCGASGVYRGMCVSQFIDALAAASPPADVGDTLNWAPVLMRAHDLRELSDDPRLREEVLDRFWSSVALHSVYAARGLSGDALDALPLAARGHLRAALALRVVTSAEDDLSITDAQRLVSTVLDRRIDGDGVAVSGLPLPEVIDLWPFDGHGESHIAAASYLGRSRRTVANDPETDLTLSVLEAAARSDPPRMAMLQSVAQHPDQRVRWTAARLVEQLGARGLGAESHPPPGGSGAPN